MVRRSGVELAAKIVRKKIAWQYDKGRVR